MHLQNFTFVPRKTSWKYLRKFRNVFLATRYILASLKLLIHCSFSSPHLFTHKLTQSASGTAWSIFTVYSAATRHRQALTKNWGQLLHQRPPRRGASGARRTAGWRWPAQHQTKHLPLSDLLTKHKPNTAGRLDAHAKTATTPIFVNWS